MFEEYCQKQPPEVFCEKGVLYNFTKLTEKHQCQGLFFRCLGLQLYWKRDSVTGVFLWIFWKFKNTISWDTSGGCFWSLFSRSIVSNLYWQIQIKIRFDEKENHSPRMALMFFFENFHKIPRTEVFLSKVAWCSL